MRAGIICRVGVAGAWFSLFAGGAMVASAEPPAFRVEVTGSGPAMLLLPGLNSPGAVWDGVVDHFKDRYTCHVVTLAGFAGQPPLSKPSLATVRDGILAYLNEHRLDRPVVVGHSLGAFLAFWLAATAPERIGPVIAVDGVPFLPA